MIPMCRLKLQGLYINHMDIAVRERPNHSLTQIDGPMSRP